MTYEVGDTLRFASEYVDGGGVLVNATTVALALFLDDVALPPVVVVNPPTVQGRYVHPYSTTVGGHYEGRWLFTTAGGETSAYVETFDVESGPARYLFSLNVAKGHLNIPLDDHGDDEELRGWLATVTDLVEDRVGPCCPVEVTETHYPPDHVAALWLRRSPVLALTSITPIGTGQVPYLPADVNVDQEWGRVTLAAGVWSGWTSGYQVAYLAGRRPIPIRFRQAGEIILQHLWTTQRGPSLQSVPGGEETTMVPGYGFAVPNRALQLLGPPRPGAY